MKIQYNSVIGAPFQDSNSQCLQCCFRDMLGPYKCLPYLWYECHLGIQFKKIEMRSI